MLKTITPKEMKRVENRVMAQTSITGEALMHTAAAHVAKAVLRYDTSYVLCLCGTGNNGGDGLAAMRQLLAENTNFRGECWLLPGSLSPDAQRELNLLKEAVAHQPRVAVRRLEPGQLPQPFHPVTCIIDAMFGTGLSRPLQGQALDLCLWTQQTCAPIVSVDIPSGLHGETGDVLGAAVCAAETVTFHRPKPGLYLKQGPDHAGRITTADIGLRAPAAASLDDADGMEVLERGDLAAFLPPRRKNSHKGSYGRVLIWAGSRGMAGAAAICATAALRCGAGLVTIACPESIWMVLQTLCPCATCVLLPENAQEAWPVLQPAMERADAIALGCGLGQGEPTAALLTLVVHWLQAHPKPGVIDADALNLLALSGQTALWPGAVLTPHPAETARLLHCGVAQITENMPLAAQTLCQTFGASVVLKGTCSVLSAENGMALNPFGTPAMAKGGSGDALTGVLAALLAGRAAGAYDMSVLHLLQTGCALHGLAGMQAEKRFGSRGVLATDLCQYLGMDDSVLPSNEPQTDSLGQVVTVTVEYKAGERDAKRPQPYPLNMGYVQEVLAQQDEWQNACLLGVSKPVEWFEGQVVATAVLEGESWWLVDRQGARVTPQDVRQALAFWGDATEIHVLQ